MTEQLLFVQPFLWEGKSYQVHVYRHENTKEWCSHKAETTLGPGDMIICDGRSPEDVLRKQQLLLPLAILSRSLL
jgi:hypothetical protein